MTTRKSNSGWLRFHNPSKSSLNDLARDKPTRPGFYWMKAEGMRSRVIEIKQDARHSLYIVQSGRVLADMPDHDRAWAGPLEEPR